jgi:diadenosine tetraphosphate (Ap4A) HIT family hydrolase
MRILLFLALVGATVAQTPTPCVFCEIVAGQRQQEGVVYRDERVMAFLSIGPRNPGHMLVVPVVHAENFLEMPDTTMHALTDAAKRIARAMQRTDLKMEGFHLQMNTGRAAGQSVFHAHLHIIPRFAADEARQRGDGQSSADKPMIGPKGAESRVPSGQSSAQAPAKTPEDRVGMDVLAPVAAKIRAALDQASALGATHSTFELPAINTEVPLPKIKEICMHYGLHALWAKIEKDPPPRPFKSDGCTGWFDDWRGVSLYPAGFLHDLKYWAGYPGEDVERLIADAELMTDVARLLKSTTMAETMFHGVRVGGNEDLQTPFSWGFGRHPLPAR